MESMKPYEVCPRERVELSNLLKTICSVERGSDPYATRRGFFRKAYRSKIDSTLQPYVVFIPAEYDRKKTYPLVVFLHGSASTEMSIESSRFVIPDGYIGLGPFGRGPSNGFARDHAQDDIAEAITAVQRDYAVDSTRILLAGFSMGGYGVYRTYYETPKKFRAIAVFSGGPSMGERYAHDVHPPDFAEEQNLISFRGVPIFIFHGAKDQNVPIQATVELVEKLKRKGARVEFYIDCERGHEAPGSDGVDAYMRWAEEAMK
jgi:dipeptidyl aminopeptidase/acylaminoacyl peptidase